MFYGTMVQRFGTITLEQNDDDDDYDGGDNSVISCTCYTGRQQNHFLLKH